MVPGLGKGSRDPLCLLNEHGQRAGTLKLIRKLTVQGGVGHARRATASPFCFLGTEGSQEGPLSQNFQISSFNGEFIAYLRLLSWQGNYLPAKKGDTPIPDRVSRELGKSGQLSSLSQRW